MIETALQHEKAEIEAGRYPPKLDPPTINHVWICRWRRFHSIVPRQVTCQYKVSYIKKLKRLGVLWRNATRCLVFHELLFGAGKLTFLSMDEKPYRFNACGGDKVWAHRGQASVKAKELRAMLLERWTGITAVFSRRHDEACRFSTNKWEPKWAALFRAVDGSRIDLNLPDTRCKVLFAPNGSVTSAPWLQFLDLHGLMRAFRSRPCYARYSWPNRGLEG